MPDSDPASSIIVIPAKAGIQIFFVPLLCVPKEVVHRMVGKPIEYAFQAPFAKGPSGFSVGAYSLKIEIATLRSR